MRKISILLGVILLLCTGCGMKEPAAQQTYTIGVVLKAMNSQHWQEIRSGMENAVQEQDAALLLVYPSSEQAVDEQKLLISDMLEADVDALLVAPCDSYDNAWYEAVAKQKGIPLLTVDTRALDCDLPYIAADNTEIGQKAADYFMEQLPAQASVAIFA